MPDMPAVLTTVALAAETRLRKRLWSIAPGLNGMSGERSRIGSVQMTNVSTNWCRVPAGAHKPNLRLSVDGHCPHELLTDNAVAVTVVHVSIGWVTLSYRGDTVRSCLCACNSPVAVVIPEL